MNTALILLAAGASTRLGRPKQLLRCGSVSLLRHMTGVALASRASLVIVVLGANSSAHRAQLTDLPVEIVDNPDWPAGMGTSIRAGMNALPDHTDAVVLMLVDQPRVTPELLDQLITTAAPLAACEYGGSLGVPARFDKAFFHALCNLPPDAGAKSLLQRHRDRVAAIAFPEGAIDLDTPQDLPRAGFS